VRENTWKSRIVENPSFYLLNKDASLKPPWPKPSLAKTLLREKRPGEEKEYTQGYKYWFDYNIHSAEVELEVGYIPSVRNLFPR